MTLAGRLWDVDTPRQSLGISPRGVEDAFSGRRGCVFRNTNLGPLVPVEQVSDFLNDGRPVEGRASAEMIEGPSTIQRPRPVKGPYRPGPQPVSGPFPTRSPTQSRTLSRHGLRPSLGPRLCPRWRRVQALAAAAGPRRQLVSGPLRGPSRDRRGRPRTRRSSSRGLSRTVESPSRTVESPSSDPERARRDERGAVYGPQRRSRVYRGPSRRDRRGPQRDRPVSGLQRTVADHVGSTYHGVSAESRLGTTEAPRLQRTIVCKGPSSATDHRLQRTIWGEGLERPKEGRIGSTEGPSRGHRGLFRTKSVEDPAVSGSARGRSGKRGSPEKAR